MALTLTSPLAMVEALYIGYFGRAGEPGGVQFWIDQLQAGQTFAQVAAAFSVQAEAKAKHPFLANPDLVSPADFVESLYQQLLGRASDAAGKAYWVGQLNAAAGNPFSIGILIAQFISGAQGDDITVLQNKITVAETFTAKLAMAGNTGVDSNGQVTPQVAAAGADALSGVTKDPATITAANQKIDAFIQNGGDIAATFVFTNQVDNLKGASGNDVFIGDAATLSLGDTANGGSGFDTVKIFNTNLIPQLDSIEGLYFFRPPPGGEGGASAVNTSTKTGVVKVETDQFGNQTLIIASGQAVKISNQGSETITINGTSITTLNLTLNSDGTPTSGSGVTLNIPSLTTLNLTGTGADSFINNNFGFGLKTVNIDGGSKITLNNVLSGVTTIDASKAAIGASVLIDTTTAVKFVGGAGSDVVGVGASGITSADNLDGAGGIDTFRTSQGISAANGVGIKNFDVFEVRSNLTQDIDALIGNNPFQQILFSAATFVPTSITNINAGAINNLVFTAESIQGLNLTGKGFVAGGVSDTATFILQDTATIVGADIVGLSFPNVDVLNIKSLSNQPSGFQGEFNTISDLSTPDLNAITVTGNEGLSLVLNPMSFALSIIDASQNTGGLLVFGAAPAISTIAVFGAATAAGIDADSIRLSNVATSATVQGNAGGDEIILQSTNADVVKFVAASDSLAGRVNGIGTFDDISGVLAGSGSKFDISAFGLTGSQATILNRSTSDSNPSMDTDTLVVSAAAAANWFVDLGNIARGIVIVDLDGTGGAGTSYAVYVDVNKNGAFDATSDLAFVVGSAGGVLTASDFIFA